LEGRVTPGEHPCALLQVHLDLPPGGSEEIFFLLGQGADRQQALELIETFRAEERVAAAWKSVGEYWDGLLGAVQVRTPQPAMDVLLNRWLLYQALSCRIWGRTAFYQSSGAFGFRDQLQDVLSVLAVQPEIAREHILRAAAHQFEQGDVLHWWHPPSGRGVRTRFSDDLLWLPYVVSEYVRVTGDREILEAEAPFLSGPELAQNEDEHYGLFERTPASYSLYEHCKRAVERGATQGAHGLPLMGSGDWNDGMNRVGIEGRGESVWLGWFLYDVLQHFAGLSDLRGESEIAAQQRERARGLQAALEASAWDGQWYLRAFYDSGQPLGSRSSQECQIDSIAQSWAVISGAGAAERARQAMQSVVERLVRPDDRLILLFAPPFDQTPLDPGYIKGYVPGIRENGGQYTHGAIWTVWAFSLLGQGERAAELFALLNPVLHAADAAGLARYQVEPYVIAADVYGVDPHTGRGGWTWYTGSSGWYYRLGVEALLGLRREGARLRLDPVIPAEWDGFEMTYRHERGLCRIRVSNPEHVEQGIRRVHAGGVEQAGVWVALAEGEQVIEVILGRDESKM
ncbi:MAG TPA: protein ndvB, partial [Anaerolineaceae bacterium]